MTSEEKGLKDFLIELMDDVYDKRIEIKRLRIKQINKIFEDGCLGFNLKREEEK
jgi:predicted ATPase